MPTPASPATGRGRTAAGATPNVASSGTTGARVTRLRAAKVTTSAVPMLSAKKSGILAKSKEGLRKVSDRMKENQKEKERTKIKASPSVESSVSSESLQAFLRIRPPPSDGESTHVQPYLLPQGDKEVLMRAPTDPSRPHITPKAPLVYSFDKVFPPSTPQSPFFTQTTLPLVDKLLQGENGLLFAYGVSNSGKSYTISGGRTESDEERGVLPRCIDVVFNSIKGMESNANLKCMGQADVEMTNRGDETAGLFNNISTEREGCTNEATRVDKNYSYAVFVSYSEVYNEKIFDLLDSVLPMVHAPPSNLLASRNHFAPPYPRPSSAMALTGSMHSSMSLAAMANGGAGVLRRRALALKNDPDGSGKYVAGLNEIRVRTREEGLAVFRAGQRARQVFGTLANRESSRSHGIFTIKVVRIHNGAPNVPDSASVSRLAVVDLAGSERTRNTGTTGDRLKEAGNINKSLMVLGQCLEVLRSNQQKMAATPGTGAKRKPAVVPFRHSKLTEIFQNFFIGDGRAVMIVNVNPYDTGFDENSHVMRFSAVAREVQTTAGNKVGFPGGQLRRQISTQFSALRHAVSGPMKIKVVVPVLPKEDENKAKLAVERESQGFVMVEEELEVIEEDGDEESEDERDAMVDHLFEQLKELKTRLYESEMRNATVEVEVREEVAKEMQETIQRMHADFSRRFQDQVSAGELKTDRKIDILSRSIPTPLPDGKIAYKVAHTPGMAHLRATPDIDGDTSMESSTVDTSFESAAESAIDESLLVNSEDGSYVQDTKDPFVVPPPNDVGKAREVEEVDESETEDESDGDSSLTEAEADQSAVVSEGQTFESYVSSQFGDTSSGTREDTAETDESEDVFNSSDLIAERNLSRSESVKGKRLGSVVDDDFNEDEEDEELKEASDEEEDIVEVDESDSEFEEDNSVSVSSPSPTRRASKASTKRRPRASSTKARVSAAKRTPAAGRRTSQAKIAETKTTPVLGERTAQDSPAVEDEDEDEVPMKSRKKRTLGKKIAMEDEMNTNDLRVSGADIRRMGSRNMLKA